MSNSLRHIVFSYKREKNTLNLIDNLKKQGITNIIVYSDGAKNHNDWKIINSIREKIKKRDVELNARPFNFGLYYNIVDALYEELDSSDTIVVLEEDLEISPSYSHVINDLAYLITDDIYSVGLMSYCFQNTQGLNYFHVNRFFCWGWIATRNNIFESDWNRIHMCFNQNKYVYNYKAGLDVKRSFKQSLSRHLDSWATFGVVNAISKSKTNIMLTSGLTRNIGFDGTHVKNKHIGIFKQSLFLQKSEFDESYLMKIKPNLSLRYSVYWRFSRILRILNKLINVINRSE